MAQTVKKNERNKHYKSRMLTLFKNIAKWIKEGSFTKALSFVPEAQKAIDTAAKKNIIYKRNADRKKSAIAKMINTAALKGAAADVLVATKKTPTQKTLTKKTTTKKASS